MKTSQTPSFDYEQQYWQQSIAVAGVDEAGMGALAGPVVAAAALFTAPPDLTEAPPVRDSKKLSAKQREAAAAWIRQTATAWAVGEADVTEIDALNIRAASHVAMQRAVDGLTTKPDLILIDGNPAQPHPTVPATTVVGGDGLIFSIAAASILAKVNRDAIMVVLATEFPEYGFAGHKGYGSAAHLAALKEHGPVAAHRTSYAPVAAQLRST
ncbi:ribonuclease HII [bacterium]|nr:ribonuclease HII [bacterium]